jgi:histone deacetylase complex regulatory component SIN3
MFELTDDKITRVQIKVYKYLLHYMNTDINKGLNFYNKNKDFFNNNPRDLVKFLNVIESDQKNKEAITEVKKECNTMIDLLEFNLFV